MQSDLTFKERQLKASQSTQERLEAELNKRKAELEKIDQLDKKIALELENLTNKMGSMKDQMEIFKNVCLQNWKCFKVEISVFGYNFHHTSCNCCYNTFG